jgi:hypothetical protein
VGARDRTGEPYALYGFVLESMSGARVVGVVTLGREVVARVTVDRGRGGVVERIGPSLALTDAEAVELAALAAEERSCVYSVVSD